MGNSFISIPAGSNSVMDATVPAMSPDIMRTGNDEARPNVVLEIGQFSFSVSITWETFLTEQQQTTVGVRSISSGVYDQASENHRVGPAPAFRPRSAFCTPHSA